MKMDRKSLFIALVILIVIATIIFNFETFTGQAGRLTVLQESLTAQPKGEGSVIVEPKVIIAGEQIYITIVPGENCIDNEITIYKKDRKLPIIRFEKAFMLPSRDSARYQVTSRSKYCEEVTIQYKTWNSWEEGDYYVEVKDLPLTKMTGKIKERTTYYTDDFKIKKAEGSIKIIISKIGSFISNPREIFGQRYIFRD